MTFTTTQGHLIYPGSITFAASQASAGQITFNIDISGTVAQQFQFAVAGSDFEDAQWEHFIAQVGSFCAEGT
jgi:hypothetical protein